MFIASDGLRRRIEAYTEAKTIDRRRIPAASATCDSVAEAHLVGNQSIAVMLLAVAPTLLAPTSPAAEDAQATQTPLRPRD
jgi:hypothetical protein